MNAFSDSVYVMVAISSFASQNTHAIAEQIASSFSSVTVFICFSICFDKEASFKASWCSLLATCHVRVLVVVFRLLSQVFLCDLFLSSDSRILKLFIAVVIYVLGRLKLRNSPPKSNPRKVRNQYCT